MWHALCREAEAEKKAEAARKKAERDALLAEEESQQRSIPKNAKSKTAAKKSQKGTTSLDLLSLGPAIDEAGAAEAAPTLNASGIDNALDAWSLATDANDQKIDRRPERRYRAAYKAYEDRRLPQIAEECPGLRRQQRVEMCRKEFDRSDANPFNQAGNVDWNATKEEVTEARERIRSEVEGRLAEKPV